MSGLPPYVRPLSLLYRERTYGHNQTTGHTLMTTTCQHHWQYAHHGTLHCCDCNTPIHADTCADATNPNSANTLENHAHR